MQDFIKANYHTHTYRCKHAYDTEREYIEAAIEMGIEELGFADHVPCPFTDGYVSGIRMTMQQAPEYVETIRRLGAEYKHDIRIYVGFEAEYIPEFYEEQMRLFRNLGCDYMIMGQHFWRNEEQGPYAGTETNDESRIREYVDSVIEGMKTGSYCYLAHPDLINYQGMDSVYEWEMTRLCKAMKELEIPLEINMLGSGEGRKHYPAERFWRIAGEIGNQAILGLDAHCVRQMRDVESYQKCMQLVEKYNLNLINRLEEIK
jgi:histidinol-phosphatase (PHP family)